MRGGRTFGADDTVVPEISYQRLTNSGCDRKSNFVSPCRTTTSRFQARQFCSISTTTPWQRLPEMRVITRAAVERDGDRLATLVGSLTGVAPMA